MNKIFKIDSLCFNSPSLSRSLALLGGQERSLPVFNPDVRATMTVMSDVDLLIGLPLVQVIRGKSCIFP